MTGAVAAAAVLGATSGAEAGREHRSIDGAGNNATHREWGRAGMPLLRLAPAAYDDGVAAPPGGDRPGPRVVSNGLCAQSEPIPCAARVTDFLWQWGQFLDHDLDLTETMDPVEPFDIEVPAGDVHFDPLWTGTQVIYCDRSAYVPAPVADAPRQQLNAITAFIDASQVYGSDPVRAAALRTSDGTGRLATSPGRLLPFNEAGLPNAGGPDPSLFLAGDVRANEQVALTSLHTLFVREHNRLAGKIRRRRPDLSGDEVYERARAKVGALMQVITYREFLPALLGDDAISPYAGYDDGVDPGISNEFSTAAYRLGHSMLSS
ncbi:MAG: peroxidase family protein, partial [Planctomycetota bacterium]